MSSDETERGEDGAPSDASGGTADAPASPEQSAPAAAPPTSGAPSGGPRHTRKKKSGEHDETPKEVAMSVIMSFALVFIFTRFVVASYVIPTGSMAPTLMGAHVRVQSAETGQNWAVNPSKFLDRDGRVPAPMQENLGVEDRVTGREMLIPEARLRFGDRIFVLHYIYALFEPSRWDVVVFKYPGNARENYIKRLVGLPGEQVWVVDGDVFTRAVNGDGEPTGEWRIQRKPTRLQRDLWYELYSSENRPLSEFHDGRAWRDRWIANDWTVEGDAYVSESTEPVRLRWNNDVRPIDDWVAYNDTQQIRIAVERGQVRRYPVSDVRMRADIEPRGEGLRVIARLEARGHVFRAVIEGEAASIQMRERMVGDSEGAWTTLATAEIEPLPAGRVAPAALWHVDQRLELWLRGKRVCSATYDWGPLERLSNVFGRAVTMEGGLNLANPRSYEPAQVEWIFEGAPVAAHRVGLDRDIWYQPVPGSEGRGTTPDSIVTLRDEQHFVLGDNSAASSDSRRWDSIDPWVARSYDERIGVVPRELMMGKAFFVFWPSPTRLFGLPVIPDFGRMRFIR